MVLFFVPLAYGFVEFEVSGKPTRAYFTQNAVKFAMSSLRPSTRVLCDIRANDVGTRWLATSIRLRPGDAVQTAVSDSHDLDLTDMQRQLQEELDKGQPFFISDADDSDNLEVAVRKHAVERQQAVQLLCTPVPDTMTGAPAFLAELYTQVCMFGSVVAED